jgi:hypothetical protein
MTRIIPMLPKIGERAPTEAVQLRTAKSSYQQDEHCATMAMKLAPLTSLIPAEGLSEVQRCSCLNLLMAAACANIATLAFSKPAARVFS